MRRRAANSSIQFSLFPFLAVLLCTMGSLIVLLLVLVQQARVEANEQLDTPSTPVMEGLSAEELEQQRREDEEHLHQLAEMEGKLGELRTALQEELQTSQMQLSHLEEHSLRLRDQLAQLKADFQVLEQSSGQDANERQQGRIELLKLKEQIDKARIELERAKQLAAAKPRSFSIVPYDGPRGTKRRPIYLECREDYLIVQPEGHVIPVVDMQTNSPGNPLAAALRATREHLVTTGALRGGEPYPLLLVRPDGARTYSAARNAMSSWGSEYGYELIDAEMPLEYPPADEVLADVVRRSIELARRRQEVIARTSARTATGSGNGGGFRGVSSGGSSRSPGGTFLAPSRNGGFEVRGNSGGSDWLDKHVARPNSTGGSDGLGEARSPSVHDSLEHGAASGTGEGQSGSQNVVASSTSNTTAGGFYPTEQPQTNASSAGQPSLNQTPSPNGSSTANFAPSQGAAVATPFNSSADASPNSQNDATAASNVAAIAQSRGDGWALPASARGATPFRRPIRVLVKSDQLVVLPDQGDARRARVVPLDGAMHRTIDSFVSQLWEHMNGWGIAGAQAYWKPILSVEVESGAEARFAELQALMQQSGVEVERKR